jgi:hypothetical protein
VRIFEIHPLAAAIILAVLCMGIIGTLVVLPIACIQWTWNIVVPQVSVLPTINPWQASLLYIAMAIMIYLTGWIQLDVKIEKADQ